MKQIVLEAPGRFIERKAPVPVPAQGEALLHIQKVGVCGSDFHAFAGRHPVYTYPRVLGHELSGVVIEAPENDRGIRAGDRCAIDPYISCGVCHACVIDRPNCCEQLQVIGIHVDGGMQPYLCVPVGQLYKSEQLSLEQLALVETLGIGAHAVARSDIQPGADVLVVGAGPIGIAVAQFAAAAGAVVRIVETSELRRTFVTQMGLTALALSSGLYADVVFDATGSAQAMSASLALVATGGTLVYVGLTKDPVCIDDSLFHRREVKLLASRNSCHQFPRIIRLIEQAQIDTTQWITDRLDLAEVTTQFGRLTLKKGLIKAIVNVQDGKL